jgi:hypothetical protein
MCIVQKIATLQELTPWWHARCEVCQRPSKILWFVKVCLRGVVAKSTDYLPFHLPLIGGGGGCWQRLRCTASYECLSCLLVMKDSFEVGWLQVQGVKRPGPEADPSSLSSAEVKNV